MEVVDQVTGDITSRVDPSVVGSLLDVYMIPILMTNSYGMEEFSVPVVWINPIIYRFLFQEYFFIDEGPGDLRLKKGSSLGIGG